MGKINKRTLLIFYLKKQKRHLAGKLQDGGPTI
jgi:hypothetical protein